MMKTVPPNWKFETQTSSIHSFSWRARLMILLGYNVRLVTTTLSEHSAGKSTVKADASLTVDLPTVKKPIVWDGR